MDTPFYFDMPTLPTMPTPLKNNFDGPSYFDMPTLPTVPTPSKEGKFFLGGAVLF